MENYKMLLWLMLFAGILYCVNGMIEHDKALEIENAARYARSNPGYGSGVSQAEKDWLTRNAYEYETKTGAYAPYGVHKASKEEFNDWLQGYKKNGGNVSEYPNTNIPKGMYVIEHDFATEVNEYGTVAYVIQGGSNSNGNIRSIIVPKNITYLGGGVGEDFKIFLMKNYTVIEKHDKNQNEKPVAAENQERRASTDRVREIKGVSFASTNPEREWDGVSVKDRAYMENMVKDYELISKGQSGNAWRPATDAEIHEYLRIYGIRSGVNISKYSEQKWYIMQYHFSTEVDESGITAFLVQDSKCSHKGVNFVIVPYDIKYLGGGVGKDLTLLTEKNYQMIENPQKIINVKNDE